MPLDSTLCVLLPKTFILVIGMNNKRAVVRRVEEGIYNVGAQDNQAPLQDNQVPPVQDVFMGDQVQVVPPRMTDGEIREAFLNIAKCMNSQANAITSQVKSMTVQVNR